MDIEDKKLGAFLIAMLLLLSLFNLGNKCTNTYNSNEDYKYDSITINYTKDTAEYKISRISPLYDEDGTKMYKVYFSSSAGDIECVIPEKYFDDLSKEAIYEADVTYIYAKEPYETLLNSQDLGYETVDDAVKYYQSEARLLSKAEFMFSEFISSGIHTKDEAQTQFEELFLADSLG